MPVFCSVWNRCPCILLCFSLNNRAEETCRHQTLAARMKLNHMKFITGVYHANAHKSQCKYASNQTYTWMRAYLLTRIKNCLLPWMNIHVYYMYLATYKNNLTCCSVKRISVMSEFLSTSRAQYGCELYKMILECMYCTCTNVVLRPDCTSHTLHNVDAHIM